MTEHAATPAGQVIVQAATVIVFRRGARGEPEIVMVQRSKSLSFAGAATVFPGGKIHETDLRLAARYPQEDAAARIAGIREVLEETGLALATDPRPSAEQALEARAMLADSENLAPVLDRFGWTLDIASLVPFARWLPSFHPGRIFDTRFYLADLGSGQVDLSPDFSENTRLFWASAREALAMIDRGEIRAIYPTRRNLERLAQFGSFAEAADHARATPSGTVSPWVEQREEGDMLCIPEGLGYPVTTAPLSQIRIA